MHENESTVEARDLGKLLHEIVGHGYVMWGAL